MIRSIRSMTSLALAIGAMVLAAAAGSPATKSQAPATGSQATPASGAAQSAPVASQAARRNPIPDTFTNLKVLPPDIKKADLVAIMKAMSIGLKVRCANCHVATDDLSQADFPSDEKPTKVAAREMLRTLFDTRAKYPAITVVSSK